MLFLALALTSPLAITTRVDLIELNHTERPGCETLHQMIFYRWSPDYQRMDVVAWRIADKDLDIDVTGRGCVVRWRDEKSRTWRRVESSCFRETWTDYDPERANLRLRLDSQRERLF